MPLSKEDLMKPRYKVIGDWPGREEYGDAQDWNIGYIIEMPKDANVEESCKFLNKYPHLFELLHWSDEREIEELPEYVKTDKYVFRHEYKFGAYGEILCNQWLGNEKDIRNSTDWFKVESNSFQGLEPATEADYNHYKTTHP